MTPDPWCAATSHGTRRDYLLKSNKCRCAAARAAVAAYQRQRWHDLREGRPRTIDATGTRRRIQALMRAGWSCTAIGEFLYVGSGTVWAWRERYATVTPATAQQVADLYDRLGLDAGPSVRARRAAERAGWPAPIEWGPDIDDPAAKPLDLDRPLRGGPYGAAPMSDIEMLVDTGHTWTSAAIRLGTNRQALERRLIRSDRRDLTGKLSRASEAEYAAQNRRNQWSA